MRVNIKCDGAVELEDYKNYGILSYNVNLRIDSWVKPPLTCLLEE